MIRFDYDRASSYNRTSLRINRCHFDVNIPRGVDKIYYVDGVGIYIRANADLDINYAHGGSCIRFLSRYGDICDKKYSYLGMSEIKSEKKVTLIRQKLELTMINLI